MVDFYPVAAREFYFHENTRITQQFSRSESGSHELDRWNQLVADLPTPEVRNEIQKLCGWIEADAAFIAFANYKRHRPTMARNPLKAFGASVGLYLRNLPKQEREARLKFEKEWGRQVPSSPKIESNSSFTKALSYAGAAGSRACSPFERLLFSIWPILLHVCWNSVELQTFLRPYNIDPPHEFFNDIHSYLENRGLGFAEIHGSKGNVHGSRQPKNCPVGGPLVR